MIRVTEPRSYQRVRVTSGMALDFLANNRQHAPDARKILRFMEIMRAGAWEYRPGDCLVFNRRGEIVNGQHRLFASALFGLEFDTDVCAGQA